MNLKEEFKKKLKTIRAQCSYYQDQDFEINEIIEKDMKQNLAIKIGEELYKNKMLNFECEKLNETNKITAKIQFILLDDLKEIINDLEINFKERKQ